MPSNQTISTLALLAALQAALTPASGQLSAQTTPRSNLAWRHEFVRVAAACERADGSLLVTDPGDNSVVLLAPDGTDRRIGRTGNGPGEYRAPGACFQLPGDSLMVFDRALKRFVLLPAGTAIPTTLPWPVALGNGWREPLGVDERGALLFQDRPNDGKAALLRWHRDVNRVDTLAIIETGDARSKTVQGTSLRRDLPFSPRTAVVATPILGVAVVKATPFTVDIRGTLTLANLGLAREDFPKVKPPFDPSQLFAGRDGSVWIRLHRPSTERAERYEVWTSAGARGAAVTLPVGRRLVGVGTNSLYVVATSEEGTETIERIPR